MNLPPNDSTEPSPQRPTALVVDAEESLRLIFCGMLEHLGFDTVSAIDGTSALTLLESLACCDVLLTDIHMTDEISGRTLASAVRDAYPHVMVILMTNLDQSAATTLDPDLPRLQKPFRMTDLMAQIEKARHAGRQRGSE